jgi:hypothetical protein
MTIEIIKYEGDDIIEILYNGKHLVNLDHDTDGWSGMEKVEIVVRKLAKEYNIEIIETEK